jgi:hypothetical protein
MRGHLRFSEHSLCARRQRRFAGESVASISILETYRRPGIGAGSDLEVDIKRLSPRSESDLVVLRKTGEGTLLVAHSCHRRRDGGTHLHRSTRHAVFSFACEESRRHLDVFDSSITSGEMIAVPFALLVAGYARHDSYQVSTALLAAEAYADSAVVDLAMKL